MMMEAIRALGPEGMKDVQDAIKDSIAPTTEVKVRSSEPVAIYAQKDVLAADGKTVVHARGHRQDVSPVDAREIVRGGLYAMTPPAKYDFTKHPEADRTAATAPGAPAAPEPAATSKQFTLTDLPGVNDKLAKAMEDAGLGTLAALRASNVETLAAVPGMGNKLAQRVLETVAETYPVKEG